MFYHFDDEAKNEEMVTYSEQTFESIKHYTDDGQEFWYARELSKVLQYADWRNFQNAIFKAMEACQNSGNDIEDHFGETTNMINLGKSAMGIFTGNFENLSQAQEAIKSGGIIDSLSNVLDSVLSKVTKKGWIKYGTSTLIRQGKNVILDNISKSIENSFTNQINNLDKLVKYENNWKAYYKDKNLNGMEKEYRKINEKLKELMPFETALKQARQIENLHKIIKNNGGDFNLTQEQIELSKMLV